VTKPLLISIFLFALIFSVGGFFVARTFQSNQKEPAITYNISADISDIVSDQKLPVSAPILKKIPAKHIKTPKPLRGIYMTSWVAGTPSFRDTVIRFIQTSEINAVVIDVKDYSGQVSFRIADELVDTLNSEDIRVPDMNYLIEQLHADNIYVIARISVFQDPIFAAAHPHLAVQTTSGDIWKDRKGLSWVDPASTEMWITLHELPRQRNAQDLTKQTSTTSVFLLMEICKILCIRYGMKQHLVQIF
jgi:hypothetical protein